jgi:hypothetical protein
VTEQAEKGNQQVLEPIEQESIPFHGESIVAVKLANGHIAVVLRWVCTSLHIDTQAQVRRIQRTATTASELVRVKVQTKGGQQTMAALTLRGFSPWVLGINPGEVRSADPEEDERIRTLIIAYQEEAKDVLYEHFVNKRRPFALPEPAETRAGLVIPDEPETGASHEQLATYHETMALWHRYQADLHAQAWRNEVHARIEEQEVRIEARKSVIDLIPDIIERLGHETLTMQHQRHVQAYVRQLHEATGRAYPTIYEDLKLAFGKPRYQDLLEDEWPVVEHWFVSQIERARKRV